MVKLTRDVRAVALPSASSEARRLGDRRTGTHHLLMGLLSDPSSLTCRLVGVDLDTARSALTDLDKAALSAVGVETVHLDRPGTLPGRRRPPFTSGARRALHEAVVAARAEGSSQIEERHLLRAILMLERPDPARQLLDALRVDPVDALSRLS
jgi:ATP-dependent Clp protease ATP-binding subunit ClpA